MSIRRMTTKQLKNYYESDAEEDHSSDSDYTEEDSSSESEHEYNYQQDEQLEDEQLIPVPRTRRSVGPKPDAHTIEITSIKNDLTKEIREKKQKKKTQTKKMAKVRGYKRARILDGSDWTSSMDPDRIRTRSEHKRFQEERNIHEDMLMKLEADGHLLRYNKDELLVLCK
jgi:uncharacterized protein YacL (UPF0231 family)